MITRNEIGNRVTVILVDGTIKEGWLEQIVKSGPMTNGTVRTDMNEKIVSNVRYIKTK